MRAQSSVPLPPPNARRVLRYIAEHRARHGFAPTHREIALALGFASTNTVAIALRRLERELLVERVFNGPRALALTDFGHELLLASLGEEARMIFDSAMAAVAWAANQHGGPRSIDHAGHASIPSTTARLSAHELMAVRSVIVAAVGALAPEDQEVFVAWALGLSQRRIATKMSRSRQFIALCIARADAQVTASLRAKGLLEE